MAVYLIGIDIGTSSTKTTIFDENGRVVGCSSKDYVFESRKNGYAEQDPDTWWDAAVVSIRQALAESGIDASAVAGVGFSGQMHGLVCVDRDGKPLRKAILHCDVRARDEADEIQRLFGGGIEKIVCNPIFPGFQLTSLEWLKRHERDSYDRIERIMCPKDFVRYRLTGEFGTEHTDASGTLLYDNRNECWSDEIFDRLGIDRSIVAEHIGQAYDLAGCVTRAAAEATGLREGTPVVYGGADQAMQSLGNGVYAPGITMMTIGTSGQVLVITREPLCRPKLNTHIFRHVEPGTWYGLGAVLFAGSTLSWFRRNFAPECSFEDLSAMVEQVPAGSDGLVFLPCMGGERTPYLDPLARGVFDGITMHHNRAHFARAIMEGVSFAMKAALEELRDTFGRGDRIICAGGGVKGNAWAQIQADVYAQEVLVSSIKEQACLGAAICAGVGSGRFSGVLEGCAAMCDTDMKRIEPRAEISKKYEQIYSQIYSRVYSSNAALFREIASI